MPHLRMRHAACGMAVAMLLSVPFHARAQSWPSAGVVLGAGISAIDGKGALGASAGLTRRWGPAVGSLLGDLMINQEPGYLNVTVDPLNGRLYCGTHRVSAPGSVCPARVAAVGGALAEIGVSLEPLLPVVIGRGYRFAPVSEPYWVATFQGATSKAALRWMFRTAIGGRMAQVHGGVIIDLDLVVR